jgi:RNA polymerase sigma-70 factor, ECF subfamily
MAPELTLLPLRQTQVCGSTSEPRPVSGEFWGECFSAYYRYVLKVCRRYFRQREEAEDAAAEVFLKLYRVMHQRNENVPFRPWLCQVAGNHCLDRLRRTKWERKSWVEDGDMSGFVDHSVSSPLGQILDAEKQRRVREQVLRLPAKYKVPLILRYYKRMSYSQIAQTLNRGIPAIRMIIFRAKNELRNSLYA